MGLEIIIIAMWKYVYLDEERNPFVFKLPGHHREKRICIF